MALFNIIIWYNIEFSARVISTSFLPKKNPRKKNKKKPQEKKQKRNEKGLRKTEFIQIIKFETCLRRQVIY